MSLIIDNFSTGYNKEDIVSSINISLNDKEWIGIIGSNGSGKSTFLKGIARVLKPYSGVVYLDEINVHESNTKQIAREISFLPQQLFNGCNLTVHELVSLGRSPQNLGRNLCRALRADFWPKSLQTSACIFLY